MLQRHAIEKLHDDKRMSCVLADLVNGADIGMVQGRRGSGLPTKAFERLGVSGYIFRKKL